jgi:hypothetical protein
MKEVEEAEEVEGCRSWRKRRKSGHARGGG